MPVHCGVGEEPRRTSPGRSSWCQLRGRSVDAASAAKQSSHDRGAVGSHRIRMSGTLMAIGRVMVGSARVVLHVRAFLNIARTRGVESVRVQKILRLIIAVAGLAQPALVAIKQLWKILNDDGLLTIQMERLLESLRRATTTLDRVEKLRRSLNGVETYLGAVSEVPDEQSISLRARVGACRRQLDLAESLSGSQRRRVVKAVGREVSELVRLTLTLGMGEADQRSPAPNPRQRTPVVPLPLRRHRDIELS